MRLVLEHLGCGTKVTTYRVFSRPQQLQFRCPVCEVNVVVDLTAEDLASAERQANEMALD